MFIIKLMHISSCKQTQTSGALSYSPFSSKNPTEYPTTIQSNRS